MIVARPGGYGRRRRPGYDATVTPAERQRDERARRSRPALTIRDRLLRTPGIWLYFVLVALAPVVLGLAVHTLRVTFSGADHGILVNDWGTVEVADSRWPGVAPGDRVIEMRAGGKTLGPPYHVDAPGDVVAIFERDGERRELTAQAIPFGVRDQAAMYVRLLSGSLLFLIGLVAFLLKPGPRSSWLFLLFCYSLAVLSLLFYRHTALSYAVQYLTMSAAGGLGLHLFSEFPRRVELLARRLWPAFYLPVLVLPPLAFTVVFDPEGSLRRWALLADRLLWIWTAVAAVSILAIVAVQWGRARAQSRSLLVRQYRLLLVGVAGGLVLPASLSILVRVVGVQSPLAMQLAVSTIVLFAVFAGWALVRVNALEVDPFTTNLVAYSVTVAIATVVFGAVLVVLAVVADGTRLAGSPPILVALTASVTLATRPVHAALLRRIDRVFHRDTGPVIEDLPLYSQRIQSSPNGEAAAVVAIQAWSGLQADRVRLWRPSGDGTWQGWAPEVAGDTTRSEPPGAALARWFETGRAAGVEGAAPDAMSAAAQANALEQDVVLAVPIRAREGAVAAAGLGRKRSGLAYTEREVAFASAIAQQLAFRLESSARGDSQIGRYTIDKRLGVGGAAEVFLARQTGPGGFERFVALKRPLPGFWEERALEQQSFFDEARLVASLAHPNIVQVFEVGQDAGAPFIAMEYVDGLSLRSLIRIAPIPPLRVAVAIGDAVLRALHYAHEKADARGRPRRLVHRDVTPGNILISRSGEVKLVDFGIAVADEERLYRTAAGLVRGTPAYMSPEHSQGLAVDRRTDVFAAACVICELATGDVEFRGYASRRKGTGVKLPAIVEATLRRGLAPRRAERWQSAEEMRVALLDSILPDSPASQEEVAAWVLSCPTIAAETNPALLTASRTVASKGESGGVPDTELHRRG